MSSNVTFPSPLGGVPVPLDLAPSILFAALYAIVACVGIYRMATPSTRTIVALGPSIFVIERVVLYSLRAKQASIDPAQLPSNGLMKYWETTLLNGYLTIWVCLQQVLQCLVVQTTMGTAPTTANTATHRTRNPEFDSESTQVLRFDVESTDVIEDRPEVRKKYRGRFGLLALQQFVPLALFIIAGSIYTAGETDPGKAGLIQLFQIVGDAVMLVLILEIQGAALWAIFRLRRLRKDAAWLIIGIATLLGVMTLYRLAVSRDETTYLLSTAGGSLNTRGAKAAFYVFHAAIEFIAVSTLVCVKIREMFSTGPWGDRIKDPKPKN